LWNIKHRSKPAIVSEISHEIGQISNSPKAVRKEEEIRCKNKKMQNVGVNGKQGECG
jgi:hypothetical protein